MKYLQLMMRTTKLLKVNSVKKCIVSYVPGVGVDLSEYQMISEESKSNLRQTLNLKPDDFLLVYVAEQTKGKNQTFLIHDQSIKS